MATHRDSTDSGHCVETCLTKLANDQPCSRDLDDETGEPSTPGAEDIDHRRVRMGMSSFNKQERLERKEVDEQPDKPEPAKRLCSPDGSALEGDAKFKVKLQNDSTESGEQEGEDEVEFKRLSSEFNTLIQEDKPQSDSVTKDIDRNYADKEQTRSRRSSSGSSSGRSSPVQERPKQMFEIPDEMRLAAGVAQDRRSRVDRPARSALFSSTEVLVEQHMTPTEEKPTVVNIEVEDDDDGTSIDERIPPIAMPRTVTPDTQLSESREANSDSEKEDAGNKESESGDEERDSVPKKMIYKVRRIRST